jgi:rSAM/selenodomain-associated transferase 1
MAESTLIIFVKNPIPGTVKTRIARTVGDNQAVAVYRHLLRHTQEVTRQLSCRRVVYYGDFVNPDDGWNGYDKRLQVGTDLGQRMQEAFREQFEQGADQIAIIGSDCLSITASHIETAFVALTEADVVIGPATDGGYYLLAIKKLHTALFEGMPWSQPELCQLTELAILQNDLTFERLEELTDIDEWADYENALK